MLDKYDYRLTVWVRHPYCFSTATLVTPTRLNVSFIRTLPVLCPSSYRCSSFSLCCPFNFACSTCDCVYTTLTFTLMGMLPNSKQTLKHEWNFYPVIIFWEAFLFSRSTVGYCVLFDLLTVAEKCRSMSSAHGDTFFTKIVWIQTVLWTCGRWFFFPPVRLIWLLFRKVWKMFIIFMTTCITHIHLFVSDVTNYLSHDCVKTHITCPSG